GSGSRLSTSFLVIFPFITTPFLRNLYVTQKR
ncbi:MAG: hypothetical protein QOH06_5717, partial [Acidobacteriota bacterium]|nr:hypothetical protein [Acidobacteriota bacterium]MEA2564213.1 hypothetical protein [Acidobacteriota bacterium]